MKRHCCFVGTVLVYMHKWRTFKFEKDRAMHICLRGTVAGYMSNILSKLC